MTAGGWVFMVCSLGFVLALVGFCFHRVFTRPETSMDGDTPPDSGAPDRQT